MHRQSLANRGPCPRVVVAGGAGFLGSHLCERLLIDGAEVICLDDFRTGTQRNLDGLTGLGKLVVIDHDITRPVGIDGPVDAVFDLASPASPADYLRLPAQALRAGTFELAGLARDKGARFVLASTPELSGEPLLQPEHSGHGETKRYAEAAGLAMARSYGVDVGIARIFGGYGPRMRRDDRRTIPAFVRQALAGQALTVPGDGSQPRSPCYVTDLVDGLVRLANAPGVRGPVTLGNPEQVSLRHLADRVRAAAGSLSGIEFVPGPAGDPPAGRPDITLAGRLLGWRPAVGLDQGLTRTVDWFGTQMVPESGVSCASWL